MQWWIYVLAVYGVVAIGLMVRMVQLARRYDWLGSRPKTAVRIVWEGVMWLPGIIVEGADRAWRRLK
jgi:hypothetical protein